MDFILFFNFTLKLMANCEFSEEAFLNYVTKLFIKKQFISKQVRIFLWNKTASTK